MYISDFQKRVYALAKRIPAGRVSSYGQLARALGKKQSSRAVGQALKRNPLAPAVPCHRVILSSGDLGGFQSGPKKKAQRLRKEGVMVINNKIDLSRYGYTFPPKKQS